jgi:hypothetical protein
LYSLPATAASSTDLLLLSYLDYEMKELNSIYGMEYRAGLVSKRSYGQVLVGTKFSLLVTADLLSIIIINCEA